MDYDFRNRATSSPYDAQFPTLRTAAGTSSSSSKPTQPSPHPMYGQSLYPSLGQPGGPTVAPPFGRHHPHPHLHQTSAPSSSSPSGLGIRVVLKPEYRITHPPVLSPQMGEIPRSNFQFDFDFERKILAEAEKETMNWSRLGLENHNLPSRASLSDSSSSSSMSSGGDPVVNKYIASGLNRDAVPIAVANYGDNPSKVREFVNGYTLLREMGFSSNNVADALLMYDNDTDKALAHFLNSSS